MGDPGPLRFFYQILGCASHRRRSGLMISALDSVLNGLGSSPGRGTALCSWARHLTLIVPLSTQVYKWVLANLLLGVTLRWTSISSRGVEILPVTSCYGNQDKPRPDGPLGLYTDLTFYLAWDTFLIRTIPFGLFISFHFYY